MMNMSWMEAVILGLLQGLTEFLPISSSAHLRIAGILLPGGAEPGAAFTAITQIGTEAAVLIYFRRDLLRIASAWLRQVAGLGSYDAPAARMGWLVIIGTLPIVALGLVFKDAIESSLRNLYVTAAMLIFFAMVLGAADRFGLKRRTIDTLTWKHGVLFGFAQAMALIPGVSRSGGTISAGLAMGYTREAAARYSFLLAIPAVLGSGFYQLFKSWGEAGAVSVEHTALATLIAFASGYCVIVAFLKLVLTRSYLPFVYYRLALGTCLLGLLHSGQISPT